MAKKHQGTQPRQGVVAADAAAAVRLHQSGDLDGAERQYRQLLAQHPGHVEILHLLGVLSGQRGRHAEAVDLIRKAIAIDDRNASYHANLGRALIISGRADEAELSFRRATELDPGNPESHHALGCVLQDRGNPEAAMAAFQKAVALQSDFLTARFNLAAVLEKLQRAREAQQEYQAILSADPQNPAAHNLLGNLLAGQGRMEAAVEHYVQALAGKPRHLPYQINLAGVLTRCRLNHITPLLENEITNIFSCAGINKQSLAGIAVQILQRKDDGGLLSPDRMADRTSLEEYLTGGNDDGVLRHRLFHGLLRETVVADLQFEAALTRLRQLLLDLVTDAGRPYRKFQADFLELACAMAHQCFNNEYIWFVSDGEAALLDGLVSRVTGPAADASGTAADTRCEFAVIAAYTPLHELRENGGLAGAGPAEHSPLQAVMERQVGNYMTEQRLKTRVVALTPIDDPVSRAVQSQYEDNPFPKWLAAGIAQPRSVATILRGLFPAFEPPEFLGRPMSILVAGCGTGRHAISIAATHTDSEVLAVDLSRSSLAYGMRMAEELGVTNITFRQVDILGMSELGMTFPYIECSGVLHHLQTPLDGWRILTGLLAPEGVMKVSLYSAAARSVIRQARDYIAARGFTASPGDIRKCRQEIIRLALDNAIRQVTKWNDFYSLSECRDLLFHVQEHHFTIPEVRDCLGMLGLRFIGFELEGSGIGAAYQKMFPEDAVMTDLSCWELFEGRYPDTFSNMYQFWCQKTLPVAPAPRRHRDSWFK